MSFSPHLFGAAQLHTNPAGSLVALVKLRWEFFFTPSFTKVLSLIVDQAPLGSVVQITCHRRCSFGDIFQAVNSLKCAPHTHHCGPLHGTADVTRRLLNRHLRVGAKFSVEVYLPGWVSKYYVFTIRSGEGPSVKITCFAPGKARPGVGCRA
jgi:hypothetical protein